MGDPDLLSVFHDITQAGENRVNTFCDRLVDIYAHAKLEVTEFIGKLDNPTLVNIRNNLFSKLIEILPQLKNHELYARRSKVLLTEDVYIIGYAVINRLEVKKLKKILKSDIVEDFLSQEESLSDLIDTNDLVGTCADLKISVDILSVRVTQLVKRVEELEDEVSSLKVSVVQGQHNKSSDVSVSSDEEDIQPSPIRNKDSLDTDRPTSNIQKPVMVTNKILSDAESQTVGSYVDDYTKPQEGFKHTTAYRQQILNGIKIKSNNNSSQKPGEFIGSSESPHRIQAAVPQPSSTCLVYVGRLDRSTSEDDIRAHLVDIGIANDDIADVFRLKCRNIHESSFCMSLGTTDAERKVYDSSKWPHNVIIRPFKPKNTHKTSNRPPRRYSQSPPPRLRQKFSRDHSARYTSHHTSSGRHNFVNSERRNTRNSRMYSVQQWKPEFIPKRSASEYYSESGLYDQDYHQDYRYSDNYRDQHDFPYRSV